VASFNILYIHWIHYFCCLLLDPELLDLLLLMGLDPLKLLELRGLLLLRLVQLMNLHLRLELGLPLLLPPLVPLLQPLVLQRGHLDKDPNEGMANGRNADSDTSASP